MGEVCIWVNIFHTRLGDLWRNLLLILSHVCVLSLSVFCFLLLFGLIMRVRHVSLRQAVRVPSPLVPFGSSFVWLLVSLFLLSFGNYCSVFCMCCIAGVCFLFPSFFPFSSPWTLRFPLPKAMVSVGTSVSVIAQVSSMSWLASCIVDCAGTCLVCFCPFSVIFLCPYIGLCLVGHLSLT
jgi:hypothetical protein